LKNILFYFISFIALILFSCNDSSSINSPIQSDSKTQLTINPDSEIFVTKVIDGLIGGKIQFDTTLINKENDTIKIAGELVIDSFSFDGDKEIQIIPNFSNATIQFYPSMVFKKAIKFNMLFKGLDLQKLGFTADNQINFVYIDDDGNIEPISYVKCTLIGNQRFIKVTGASLNHFSRYAFVR
jgi:hypothetical protein